MRKEVRLMNIVHETIHNKRGLPRFGTYTISTAFPHQLTLRQGMLEADMAESRQFLREATIAKGAYLGVRDACVPRRAARSAALGERSTFGGL